MRIGYKIEGKNDVAFLEGLKARWCPGATLDLEPKSRHTRLKSSEIRKICIELDTKGADFWIFLNDADTNDEKSWRRQLKEFHNAVPSCYEHRVIIGLCIRNIECWLCADKQWIARQTGLHVNAFNVDDPKGVLEGALGDEASGRIAQMVRSAPASTLRNWLQNVSFAAFYDEIRSYALKNNCPIENLREGRG